MEKTRLDNMVTFLHERLGVAIPDLLKSWDATDLKKWLIFTMDRPIRVCGMVKNEGEPGGGPFYVRSESGEISLQIVESSQIDLDDPDPYNVYNDPSWRPLIELAEQQTDIIRMLSPVRTR